MDKRLVARKIIQSMARGTIVLDENVVKTSWIYHRA